MARLIWSLSIPRNCIEFFKTYKLKAHGQIDEDLERIAKVLEVMAPDCKVRVDANQGWKNFENASKIFTKLDNEDQIDYVEQPVLRENLSDLKKLHHIQVWIIRI